MDDSLTQIFGFGFGGFVALASIHAHLFSISHRVSRVERTPTVMKELKELAANERR